MPDRQPADRRVIRRLRAWVQAVERADEAWIATAVADLARSRPLLAPLALIAGGVTMLAGGLRILLSNWKLTLIQVPPAMWVWLAMYDLRLHVLHGNSLPDLRGPIVVPLSLAVIACTVGAYFLNAVFAFAIAQEDGASVGRAWREARGRMAAIAAWGGGIGLALAISTIVISRSGEETWFVLSLGIVVALMMVTYIAVPARMIGAPKGGKAGSRRDRLSVSAIGTVLGLFVSAPPYLLGRIGLLMIGSPVLFVPGLVVFAAGAVLQAGATGAVKAIKVSARLTAARARPRR